MVQFSAGTSFAAVAEARAELGGAEFHAADVYGGRKAFKDTPPGVRLQALRSVASGIVDAQAHCFWAGLPKLTWKEGLEAGGQKIPLWSAALFGFVQQLHSLVQVLYPDLTTLVVVDENSWVRRGSAIALPTASGWPRFSEGRVEARASVESPGLQATDFLVHTLYRANKNRGHPASEHVQLSRTDELALGFVRQLTEAKRLRNLPDAVRELAGASRS